MEIDMEEFRRKFPALYHELVEAKMSLRISGVRSDGKLAEKEASSKTPTVIDYLRRCDTDEQGREVIQYLVKQGEISSETAETVLKQLDKKGIRSFGSRRYPGHYCRERL
ncbi:MAG: DUF2095 family protein [Candidatus Caldarchaeum sp.]